MLSKASTLTRRKSLSKSGSITVFLSLVGLVVFAMLGTCVETARFSACARAGAQAVQTGTRALLTEYSRPLYEHYGLFFLEGTGEPYERVIARYAGDSMDTGAGYLSFLAGELTEVNVEDKTLVGDNEAEALQKEINAYMERDVTGAALKKYLNKISKLSDSESSAEQIEKTVDEQREDTKLDERILRLMYLVDGVSVSKKGKISVTSSFAKKFAVRKDFTGSDFGVQEQVVWSKMKDEISTVPVKWRRIDTSFRRMLNETINVTKKAIEEGKRLREDYAAGSHSDMATRVISGLSSLDGNLLVLEKTKEIINDSSLTKKELKKELKSLWKDYDTASLSFDYTGADADGDSENPLDAIGDAAGSGLLKLVCENPEKISEKGIKNPDKYADFYGEQTSVGEDYSDSMDSLARDEEVELSGALGDIGSYALEEFTLDSYITKMFSSYIDNDEEKENADGVWEQALDYGQEYVVAGNKSDKANLESVLSRILLIRVVTNFAAILADTGKRAEAYAAAAAVVGFTGLTFLIRFTQTLILIAWSFAESLVDIAALLLERNVPIVKTSAQVKTSFTEIFLMTNKSIVERAKRFSAAKKGSFGYHEYLMLFMAMLPQKVRRYRVMDLIENNMRKNGYKGFSLGECAFDLTVTASFRFPAKFFRLPSIESVIGRNLSGYEYDCEIVAGYL